MKGKNWIIGYITTTIVLLVVYLLIHYQSTGSELVYFSDSQKEFIQNQYELFHSQVDSIQESDSILYKS
ncbi:MAG: hypothetical protein AAFY41_04165, partial [Bacteroidota bacterium]